MFEFNPSLQWYDHGYWIRKWLAWPSWLPLPLHADHGLNLQGTLEDHENNCSTHIHLTWNLYRYSWLKHTCRKKVFLIPHPYLTMLARSRLISSHHKCGTLVFWPHSTPDQVLDDAYADSYLSELELLPDNQKPIAICLHYHDYTNNQLLERLKSYHIITAGSPFAKGFAERFFSILSNYKYATSSYIGSYIPYCEIIGVSFFLFGAPPQYHFSSSNQAVPRKWNDPLERWLEYSFKTAFAYDANPLNHRRYELVRNVMACDSSVSKAWLRWLMLIELIRLSLSSSFLNKITRYYMNKLSKAV